MNADKSAKNFVTEDFINCKLKNFADEKEKLFSAMDHQFRFLWPNNINDQLDVIKLLGSLQPNDLGSGILNVLAEDPTQAHFAEKLRREYQEYLENKISQIDELTDENLHAEQMMENREGERKLETESKANIEPVSTNDISINAVLTQTAITEKIPDRQLSTSSQSPENGECKRKRVVSVTESQKDTRKRYQTHRYSSN